MRKNLQLSCIHCTHYDRSKLKLHTAANADFHTAVTQNHRCSRKITAHDQNHRKSHGDREYVIILQR